VASPDGKTFYFAAYDDEKDRRSSGSPVAEHRGDPRDRRATRVADTRLTCDGSTLYVADLATSNADDTQIGGVLALPTAGGA
jgi:hypothetical protein